MVDNKQSCSLENLQGVAGELRRLADQIEAGKVTVGGVTLSICNAISLKMKQKLVAGQVKFDVSLTASLVDELPPSSENADDEKGAMVAKFKTPAATNKSRPYEVKKLKKMLTQQWKQVSNAIASSKTPEPAVQQEFLEICEEYGLTAEDEWQPLWQETVNTMKQLFDLAQQGNFKEASLLLATINNQKKSCHKKYK